MKIVLNKQSLEKALTVISGTVKPNSMKEVLKCVLLNADTYGGVTIRGTDCETFVETNIDGDVERPGVVLIDCAKFRKIASNAKHDVTVELDGSNVTITSGEYETEMPTMAIDEFPPMPAIGDNANKATVKGPDLQRLILRTIRTVDTDSTRFALGGVKFIVEDGKLQLVGTDGRRLCWAQCGTIQCQSNHDNDTIVTEAGLKNVLKCLGDSDVTISLEPNAACFYCDSTTVWSRLIEGRFPNWKMVIPPIGRSQDGECEEVVTIETAGIVDCINQASVALDSESRGALFTFDNNKLTIDAKNPTIGRSKASTSVVYSGRKIAVRLDTDFVKEMAATLGEDKFDLHLLNSKASVVVRCGGDYSHVIMPMELDA